MAKLTAFTVVIPCVLITFLSCNGLPTSPDTLRQLLESSEAASRHNLAQSFPSASDLNHEDRSTLMKCRLKVWLAHNRNALQKDFNTGVNSREILRQLLASDQAQETDFQRRHSGGTLPTSDQCNSIFARAKQDTKDQDIAHFSYAAGQYKDAADSPTRFENDENKQLQSSFGNREKNIAFLRSQLLHQDTDRLSPDHLQRRSLAALKNLEQHLGRNPSFEKAVVGKWYHRSHSDTVPNSSATMNRLKQALLCDDFDKAVSATSNAEAVEGASLQKAKDILKHFVEILGLHIGPGETKLDTIRNVAVLKQLEKILKSQGNLLWHQHPHSRSQGSVAEALEAADREVLDVPVSDTESEIQGREGVAGGVSKRGYRDWMKLGFTTARKREVTLSINNALVAITDMIRAEEQRRLYENRKALRHHMLLQGR